MHISKDGISTSCVCAYVCVGGGVGGGGRWRGYSLAPLLKFSVSILFSWSSYLCISHAYLPASKAGDAMGESSTLKSSWPFVGRSGLGWIT